MCVMRQRLNGIGEGERTRKGRATVIKTAIRLRNDTVMVFDTAGEQVPEYQGQYEDVRESILRDAPPEAVFAHWFDYDDQSETIPREDW